MSSGRSSALLPARRSYLRAQRLAEERTQALRLAKILGSEGTTEPRFVRALTSESHGAAQRPEGPSAEAQPSTHVSQMLASGRRTALRFA